VAEYVFWVIVVTDSIAFAAALLAYGALGDWGSVTTDQLPANSTRYTALIVAGTYTLWVGSFGIIAVMAYGLLTVRLRRRSIGGDLGWPKGTTVVVSRQRRSEDVGGRHLL
jgi:heme/copper-type cytochrome/quinol oxidase subunit 3